MDNYGERMKGLNPDLIERWLARADDADPLAHGIAPHRWEIFVSDARKFVADGWLDRAIKAEWLDFECFGVDAAVPLGNPDEGRTGLVPDLAGRIMVGFHPSHAIVRKVGDEDCQAHPRALTYQSRRDLRKPLRLIWSVIPILVKEEV